jgi:ribosomal protein uS5
LFGKCPVKKEMEKVEVDLDVEVVVDEDAGAVEVVVPVVLVAVEVGKIGSIEEIFLFSIPVKEAEIIDYFLKDKLQDEVMKIMPVQKQSSAGQRTRFKAFVAVGDTNGHVGLGVKCSSEVATAIRGAIISAKLNIAPVRRGYWGKELWPSTHCTHEGHWKVWFR